MSCRRPLLCHQDPQRLTHPSQEVGATAQARPLAGVSLAEWLTQPQTQVMSPSSPTSSANMDPEHAPINIPDSHHNFLCPDDATTIPTSAAGLPNTEASSSSCQSFITVRTSLSQETECMSCVGSFWPPGNWCRVAQRICCHNACQFTVEREKRSRYKRCAFVERQRKSTKKSLNGKLIWPSEEKRWPGKNFTKLRQTWRTNIGKREDSDSAFEEIS